MGSIPIARSSFKPWSGPLLNHALLTEVGRLNFVRQALQATSLLGMTGPFTSMIDLVPVLLVAINAVSQVAFCAWLIIV